MNTKRTNRIALLSSAILLMSCGSFSGLDRKSGTTTGEILISPPSVDTRERLLSDRLNQLWWLQKQLAESDSAVMGIQGSSARRSTTQFAANVNANLDPGGAALFQAQQSNQLAGLDHQQALQNIDFQIEQARKKLLLQETLAASASSQLPGASAAASSASASTASTSSASASTASTSTPAAASIASPVPGAIKPSDLSAITDAQLKQAAYAALLAEAPDPGKLSNTPIENFRDKLAFRDEIRNELAASGLDDRHDIRGNALYRLGFDSTILPADDTSAWAVISVCVQRPHRAGEPGSHTGRCEENHGKPGKTVNDGDAGTLAEADFAIFKTALTSKFDNDLESIYNELEAHAKDATQKNDLTMLRPYTQTVLTRGIAVLTNTARTSPSTFSQKKDMKSLRDLAQASTFLSMKSFAAPRPEPVKPSLASIFKDHWELCLNLKNFNGNFTAKTGNIAIGAEHFAGCKDADDLNTNALVILKGAAQLGLAASLQQRLNSGANGESVKTDLTLENESLVLATDTVKSWIRQTLKRDQLEIYAYGATPKESVQRISDVVTRRESQQFALGLQALAGNLGISALTSFMNANEGIFNAIKRQPLVVGFGHSSAQGNPPAAEKLIGRADFGWIIGPKYGAAKDGKSANFRHSVIQNGLSAVVSIPGWWDSAELVIHRYWIDDASGQIKSDAVTMAAGSLPDIKYQISLPGSHADILHILNGEPRITLDEQRHDIPSWEVKVGAPAEIMVRGDNLWKNPQMRLGSQFADQIKIMPDMRGIVGIFKKVEESWGARLPEDATKEVKNSLPVSVANTNGFEVAGYAKLVKDAPAAPKTLRATGGGVMIAGVEHTLNLNLDLQGYSGISAQYREAGSAKPFADAKARVGRINAKTLSITVPALSNASVGKGIELQLKLVANPKEEAQIIAVDGPLVYQAKQADWKIGVAGVMQEREADTDVVSKFDLVLEFPKGYEKAVGKTASFKVPSLANAGVFSCTIEDHKCPLKLILPPGTDIGKISLAASGLDELTTPPAVLQMPAGKTTAKTVSGKKQAGGK